METRKLITGPAKLRPLAIALAAFAVSGSAAAFEFDTGNPELQIRWDNTLRYNAAFRVEERDPRIAANAHYDEGEYSFGKGDMVANRFDLLTELDVIYKKDMGFRISAAGWYDNAYYGQSRSNPALPTRTSYVNNEYSDYTKKYYQGPSGELLDVFVFGAVDAGPVPVKLKAGRHAVVWGESLFLGGAMHGISYSQVPLDLQKGFATPGVEAKELFRPLNQVSMQAQLADSLSFAAQYLLEWESFRFPEGGTYLGPADFAFNGPDRVGLSPALSVNRGPAFEPKQQGEYGASLRWSPEVLDGTAGLYYRNYADKMPQLFITNPTATASPLTWTEYNLIYADRIELFGLSLAKNIGGVSVGAEVSYRKNTPLNSRTLGVAPGKPAEGETKGPRGDTYHGLVNLLGTIGKTWFFDQAVWATEVTWSRWDKVNSGANLFQAEGFAGCALPAGAPTGAVADKRFGCATKDYWGGAIAFTPSWFQVLPGVDMSLPISYSRGLKGNAATTFGGNEDLGNMSLGVGFDIVQQYRVDLKYISYFGDLVANNANTTVVGQNGFTALLRDRDFVSLTLKTTF
jgi:hypothetical protein